jgi:hypothetical protein
LASVVPCVGADGDARLVRLTDVVTLYDLWVVTNPDVRNNRRVRSVKDVIVEMLRAAMPKLSGTAA